MLHALKFGEVFRSRLIENYLSIPQLRLKRDQRSTHLAGIEVGDQPHGVRELHTVFEGRPALVINQQESHMAGTMSGCERGHVALKQLRLARTRCSGNQRVRAVSTNIQRKRSVRLSAYRGSKAQPLALMK